MLTYGKRQFLQTDLKMTSDEDLNRFQLNKCWKPTESEYVLPTHLSPTLNRKHFCITWMNLMAGFTIGDTSLKELFCLIFRTKSVPPHNKCWLAIEKYSLIRRWRLVRINSKFGDGKCNFWGRNGNVEGLWWASKSADELLKNAVMNGFVTKFPGIEVVVFCSPEAEWIIASSQPPIERSNLHISWEAIYFLCLRLVRVLKVNGFCNCCRQEDWIGVHTLEENGVQMRLGRGIKQNFIN